MINAIKRAVKTDLIKTSFFTSIAITVKIITAFILNKVVAIYVGPAGVAVVGQFNNFFGILNTIASAGLNNGVIKYIAQYRHSENDTRKVISTAFALMVTCSVIAGLVVFTAAPYFSGLLFKSSDYTFLLRVVACSLLFSSLNVLLMSVLNGRKEVKKYAYANISTSLFVLVLSLFLVFKYNLLGVLLAIAMGQSLVFFITLTFVVKSNWFRFVFFFSRFDKEVLKKLSAFSVMTLISSLTGPVALLTIRNYIGTHLSWQQAGYWQGVWSISEVYLMFVTSTLGVYYLPRLSEINDKKELRNEIIGTAKIVLPVVSLMAIVVYLLKEVALKILFTDAFTPMLPLFKYQLIGDVLKIASWLIGIQMLSKAMTKLFIATEIVFSLLFTGLSIGFINLMGLEGVVVAFALNYLIYFLFLLYAFRKLLFAK